MLWCPRIRPMRRLVIVGYGDIGSKMPLLLHRRFRLYALARSEQRAQEMRRAGVTPVRGDLDHPATLARLASLGQDLLHFAPPPSAGCRDARTAALIRAIAGRRTLPQRVVYLSTSGVYGNRAGALVRESDPIAPNTDRARRRAHAERLLRAWSRRSGARLSILRVPGIYSRERLPVERLRRGTPSLRAEDDSFTNHVHADDLARLVLMALCRGKAGRVYHASDGAWMKAGEYFDAVADALGMARPRRVELAQAPALIPANALSFLQESRRLSNQRALKELRMRFRYPSVSALLDKVRAEGYTQPSDTVQAQP